MLFNSISFALFLPVVLVLYWTVQRAHFRIQNAILLVASYVFYGLWDWRFAGLLFIGTAVDFGVGLALGSQEDERRRRVLLWVSVLVNLGLLGFFKYFNFFVGSFGDLLGALGLQANLPLLNVALPVGISFYTFKKLSYTIDIQRGRLEPTRDPVAFFAFVAFFPQILAGPIDRGTTLLPQFLKRRVFSDSQVMDGARQILTGFLKKMVLADNLLPVVNDLFTNYAEYDGLSLVIGVFFAAMQLYCDFSAYSDIAIGIGKLFGFSLMVNFAFPYFSRDIAEFWRRWHISLSTWLRDYLYVPLCGERPSRGKRAVFIVVTFTLCGLWHGAAWKYVVWGFLHGLYFLPMTLKKRHPRFIGTPGKGRLLPAWKETRAMAVTSLGTALGWVFFMAASVSQAFGILGHMVSRPYLGLGYAAHLPLLLGCLLLLAVEWIQREREYVLQVDGLPIVARWGLYYSAIIVILVFGAFGSSEFIYTQF